MFCNLVDEYKQIFYFQCVNKFQQIFNVAKNLEIWRKNKNDDPFDVLVSSLIRISVKNWNIKYKDL